jgi:hypothetical protein
MRISRTLNNSILWEENFIVKSHVNHTCDIVPTRIFTCQGLHPKLHALQYQKSILQRSPSRLVADQQPSKKRVGIGERCAYYHSSSCHEAISRNNPAVGCRCTLTVWTYRCTVLLAFQTQTLLSMHIGEMAVNSPTPHVMQRLRVQLQVPLASGNIIELMSIRLYSAQYFRLSPISRSHLSIPKLRHLTPR